MTLVKRPLRTLGAAAVLLLTLASPALAGPKTPTNSTTWTGRGTTSDGAGGRTLDTTLCAPDAGADADGTYLLFVLSSTRGISGTPTITVGDGAPASMTKSNTGKKGTSSFKYLYTSDSAIDLDDLVASVTWTGSGTPTFTISHGCNEDGEGGSALTVHFVGEYDYSTSSPWVTFGDNSGGATSAVLKVCESGNTTNCVSFGYGSTPGSTADLVLSGASKTLDVTLTPLGSYAAAYLYPSAITPAQFGTPPFEGGNDSFTTTTTFSNDGDAWFVSFWD